MKLRAIIVIILMLSIFPSICGAISLSFTSGGSGGQSTIGTHYSLDSSTNLLEISTVGSGSISSGGVVEGTGDNSIYKTVKNNGASVSSSLASSGSLSASTSGQASGLSVEVGQNVYALGQSELGVSGSTNTNQATQQAGVYSGALASSQMVTAGSGAISAVQASNIEGELGYSNGQAQSSDNIVKVTGGLNGAGIIQGLVSAVASGSASATGSIDAESVDSKAYSAVKSTSSDGETFSYVSSADHLASSISGSADGHVTADQNLNAVGDARVYTSGTSDDSSSRTYSATADVVSGSLASSAGSPASIETKLQGDIQEATDGVVPTPGTWVWKGLGGYITSNPSMLTDSLGTTHIFVKGGDNALWDNMGGDWFPQGGYITSNPSALLDQKGNIHVFVRGGDSGLWDNLGLLDSNGNGKYGFQWLSLGGKILSDPSAAIVPGTSNSMKIAVIGADNAVWINNFGIEPFSGNWQYGGGYVKSVNLAFDRHGGSHIFAKGGDGALWDLYGTSWTSLGGYITSDPKPLLDPTYDALNVFARGGDGALWVAALDTSKSPNIQYNWYGFGGFMSPAGSPSTYSKANPEPVADSDENIHIFVRGGDGGLWDYLWGKDPGGVNNKWYSLGGYLTSDPKAAIDSKNKIQVAVRGGDGALWVNNI